MGGGDFFAEVIFYEENLPWRGKFPGDEFLRGNPRLGEFARIPIQNSLCSCFLIADSILRLDL